MNRKDQLYDAIKVFADGDEDVYSCLKKEIYALTHSDNHCKTKSIIAMILFFTNHNKNISDAINNYISSPDRDNNLASDSLQSYYIEV